MSRSKDSTLIKDALIKDSASISAPSRLAAGSIDSPALNAPAPNDPAAALALLLQQQRHADAARQFLQLPRTHALEADDLLSRLREHGGEDAVQRLVLAFATFACPHCRGGFENCHSCNGRGHGRDEDRGSACRSCGSLGAVACDFCGGSGFATYSFVPAALRASVAVARTDLAARRVAEDRNRHLPDTIARDQLGALRKVLAKQLLESQRDAAILVNAAQFARELRATSHRLRTFTGRLFGRASRNAKAAQVRVSTLFDVLATISRELASSAKHPDAVALETERAELFSALSGSFARSAARRSTLFPGH